MFGVLYGLNLAILQFLHFLFRGRRGKKVKEPSKKAPKEADHSPTKNGFINSRNSSFKPVGDRNVEINSIRHPVALRPEIKNRTAPYPLDIYMPPVRDMRNETNLSSKEMIANCIYLGQMYQASLMAVKVTDLSYIKIGKTSASNKEYRRTPYLC
jgi:hypothetical protein